MAELDWGRGITGDRGGLPSTGDYSWRHRSQRIFFLQNTNLNVDFKTLPWTIRKSYSVIFVADRMNARQSTDDMLIQYAPG